MGNQGSRPASLVSWKSLEDQPMSLAPDADAGGTLDVEIDNGSVTMRGKNCRFVGWNVERKRTEGEKLLAEVEITVPLAQCQINWTFVEAEGNAGLDGCFAILERSVNAHIRAKNVKKPFSISGFDKKKLLLVGGGILVVLVLLGGNIIRLRTKDGTLIVTADEPDAEVQVLNESGKVEITRKGEETPITISVVPGKHRLNVQKYGFNLFTKEFVVEAGGKQAITVKMVPER